MSTLWQVLFVLIGVIVGSYIISSILSFFDIDFERYGMYLVFFIAMGIFYAFLPRTTGNIFS